MAATRVDGRRRRKLISPSSSICKVGDNEDLLLEILIRLPGPRSAFRCKSVCKRWNSLISPPYFPRRFVSHHHTLSAAAATATDEPEPPVLTLSQARELILSFLPFPRDLRSKFIILDCNKDLLLLWFRRPRDQRNDDELRRTHLICNPFTKQWVALPLAPQISIEPKHFRLIVKLVCEPLGEGQVFPCPFRVVRIYTPTLLASSETELDVPVYIFCSRSGRWTEFVLRLNRDLRCLWWGCDVSRDGKLYWLNERYEVVKWDPFCLEHNTFPTLIGGSEFCHGLVYGLWVSEGALYVIGRRLENREHLSVWRLDEEKGRGWSKQYEVISLHNYRCISKTARDGYGNEGFDLKSLATIGLHPEKSEVAFFTACDPHRHRRVAIVSFDFKKKVLELLTCQDENSYYRRGEEKMFQPKITLWPSLVPSYKKLGNTYNESYNCWLPSSRVNCQPRESKHEQIST